MKNATKKPGGWSTVRQPLATWEKPALLALVKDLHEAAGVNRDFIHARSKAGECGGEALEKYRGKISAEEREYPDAADQIRRYRLTLARRSAAARRHGEAP